MLFILYMIIRNFRGNIIQMPCLDTVWEDVYNIKTKSAFVENFIKYIFKK